MSAVEHMPGIVPLFDVSNASGTPRLVAGEPFREGEIVARFRLELDDFDVLQIARQMGAVRVVRRSPIGLFQLYGPENGWVSDETLARLWETGQVVSAAANYTGGGLTYMPNDPHAVSGAQWFLEQPSDIDLDLPDGWDITRGSSGVTVAVMDTGLEINHPEFAGRLWENPQEASGVPKFDDDGNGYVDDINGWNVTTPNGGDPDIRDQDSPGGEAVGHGTWVSSIVLANSNNSHQVAGFDHFAKLLTVRAFDETQAETAFILAGLDYLRLNWDYYDVVNMSYVISVEEPFIEDDLTALEQTGALVVAGSGNGGGSSEIWYPAAHPIAITVGGTDDTDTLAVFSDTGNNLDFVAPAVDIVTASFLNPQGSNAFDFGEGTSFATPMVTGIASLGFSIRPDMDRTDLVFALRESAVDLGAAGWDPQHGWGRVNAHIALEVLESMLFFGNFETGGLSRWSSSVP